jgi:hypothetical protein
MDTKLYQNVLHMRPYRVQGQDAFRRLARSLAAAAVAWRLLAEQQELGVEPQLGAGAAPTETVPFLASFTYPPLPPHPPTTLPRVTRPVFCEDLTRSPFIWAGTAWRCGHGSAAQLP